MGAGFYLSRGKLPGRAGSCGKPVQAGQEVKVERKRIGKTALGKLRVSAAGKAQNSGEVTKKATDFDAVAFSD